MKRQFQIIALVITVGIAVFLSGCSVVTPPGRTYEKVIDLNDRNLIRPQLERVQKVQFIIAQDQRAMDLLCVSQNGPSSYDVGDHPEYGQVCFTPTKVSLEGGTNLCSLIHGTKYRASRITDESKVYCITGKRI